MKVLVVGTGGVGAAVAAVAQRRDFFERMTFADLDPARPQALVDRLDDDRFAAVQVDASDRAGVAALAREHDAVLNATDPRFVMPIFEAAFESRCTYLDMAMSLSSPDTLLGQEQLDQHERWAEAGLLALVGIGVEPGLSDVFARYAADHLDLDDDRGVPEPAARLGARARLVHDRAVQRARGVRLPRGHRAGRVRQRRARGGRARAALGRVQARDVQVRARRGVHRRAQDAEQAGPRLEGTGLGARRRGRAAGRPGGGAAGPGDPRRPDARQDLRRHVRHRHRCGRRAALDLPLPRVRQRADDARVRRAGGRAADRAQPGRGARAAGRRGLERDGRARAGGLGAGAFLRPARRLRRGAQAARAVSERAPMLWPGLAFLAGGALLGLLLIHP